LTSQSVIIHTAESICLGKNASLLESNPLRFREDCVRTHDAMSFFPAVSIPKVLKS